MNPSASTNMASFVDGLKFVLKNLMLPHMMIPFDGCFYGKRATPRINAEQQPKQHIAKSKPKPHFSSCNFASHVV